MRKDSIMSTSEPNSTLCALPFMAVDSKNGRYRPCCHSQDPDWGNHSDIEIYWRSDRLCQLRQNLASGVQDISCGTCWQMEQRGLTSMRQAVNLSRSLSAQDQIQPRIQQVKLITGKHCNLACMMCFRTVSSTYHRIWRSDTNWSMPEAKAIDLEYDVVMDRYIRDNAHSLKYIEALGGEPLFNKRFLDLVQHLVDVGANRHLTLFVITNGTLLTKRMQALFSKFHKTVFAVSVDGIEAVNDYQRWPSQWQEVHHNLQTISASFDMSVIPTVTALNIIGLPRLMEYCDRHDYVVNNINLVEFWPELLPSNLPRTLHDQVSDEYRNFLIGDQRPDRLLNFVTRWDQKRGIDIRHYMPEWSSAMA